MKLEIGGGKFARGDGWVSIDIDPAADVRHDLNVTPWPFEDNSVDEVCSSHCLEHIDCPFSFLNQIVRICKIGAPVEIRVPHPSSHLAMTAGHKHVFSPMQAINVDRHFPEMFWKEAKRLKLQRIDYGPTEMLAEARADLPFLANISDEAVMKWIPGTCHECRFHYLVTVNQVVERAEPWNPWKRS